VNDQRQKVTAAVSLRHFGQLRQLAVVTANRTPSTYCIQLAGDISKANLFIYSLIIVRKPLKACVFSDFMALYKYSRPIITSAKEDM